MIFKIWLNAQIIRTTKIIEMIQSKALYIYCAFDYAQAPQYEVVERSRWLSGAETTFIILLPF